MKDIQIITDDIEQQNKLLSLQNQILEDFVKWNKPSQKILDELCLCAEKLVPSAVASIMLFDGDSHLLSMRSAPSVPQSLIDRLTCIKPSPVDGSCAHSVFSGKPSFINDTSVEKAWSNVRSVAEDYNIKACWSFPVLDSQLNPIGSFALSCNKNCLPDDFQHGLLSVCANLVSLICQREDHKKELWQLANHDALTGLPNRLFFEAQFKHAINNAKRHNDKIALMFLDLDDFKDINDSYGHDFGDLVLLKAMELIKSCIRVGDLVSRHGGDEFLILLENITDQMAVDNLAQKILDAFSQALVIGEQKVMVSFSIGISFYPNDGEDAKQLLKHTDIAMYQAKNKGKKGLQYFERSFAEKIAHKVSVEQELYKALEAEELELYYQPQYIADTDELDSIEVLVRWNHPQKGLLTPKDFLKVADKSNLIREISIYVFKRACIQGASWIAEGYDVPRIAVNFSTSQLTEYCAERLDLVLEKLNFPPEKMEIEVTETLVMNRGKSGIDELKKMRSLGVTLAIDDFGTGYSSLSQLKRLPIHKLKIDQSFVADLETNNDDRVLVKTIINMGKNLGLKVVAEGVETEAQQTFLLENGCDFIQGFYRHYPVPKHEIEKLFKKI